MIIIPKCFGCELFDDGKCKAYPDGIPLWEAGNKPKEEECAEGIKYIKKKFTTDK